MNFTREPIVETIITPQEGYKLVIRNSKSGGQEEFFVDAVEVVSFGAHCFYRSLEKPKAFLLPVSDYELMEVRETRMVLKTASIEKVKIAGGLTKKEALPTTESAPLPAPAATAVSEPKRRERRRRKRKLVRTDKEEGELPEEEGTFPVEEKTEGKREQPIGRLIPPPSTLISETISRYKDTPVFEGVFYAEEGSKVVDEEPSYEDIEDTTPSESQLD